MELDNNVTIFIKNFELGRVKTRLAKSIGDEQALKIYQLLADYTISESLSAETRLTISWSRYLQEIPDIDARFKVQKEGDLGFRMHSSFRDELTHFKSAVIIGSDCPYLKSSHLSTAFLELETNDVVIGPAEDGGYYLIGLQNPHIDLFQDISWSTESVLETTIARAKALGLQVSLLEILNDTDDWEDLKRYLTDYPKSELSKKIKRILREV